jgi:hypothetical protein
MDLGVLTFQEVLVISGMGMVIQGECECENRTGPGRGLEPQEHSMYSKSAKERGKEKRWPERQKYDEEEQSIANAKERRKWKQFLMRPGEPVSLHWMQKE